MTTRTPKWWLTDLSLLNEHITQTLAHILQRHATIQLCHSFADMFTLGSTAWGAEHRSISAPKYCKHGQWGSRCDSINNDTHCIARWPLSAGKCISIDNYFVLLLILSNQLGLERLLNGDTNFQSIWFVLKILYFVIMTNSYIKVI